MGVENIWLFDPVERVVYTFTAHGLKLVNTPRLVLPNSPIYIDLAELFALSTKHRSAARWRA